MEDETIFLAMDLGAESGRGVLGRFAKGRLSLEEIHRFPNTPVRLLSSLHWDFPRLFNEVKETLRLLSGRGIRRLDGLGIDTWGVDFGLLGKEDILLGNPHHYRDDRTDRMMDLAFRKVPREEIFELTGIQFMQLNTLYQLLAMAEGRSPLLEMAETLLLMPDLFHFFLTGEKVAEFSIATTTQFYNPRERSWAFSLLERLGIRSDILPNVVKPGTVLGELMTRIKEEVQLEKAPIIAPAGHDTGSAVAAVPASGDGWCYISSGTWSLMGVEIQQPLIDERSLALNFTNEGGVCDTFRFLKNIMGLWLVQECRRAWEREGPSLSYDEMTRLAEAARPFQSVVEPDHASFLKPQNMPSAIQKYCEESGQKIPESKGEILRCALESLALKYRWVLERLEELFGKRINVIHIVGGGTKNALLCQLTADATGRMVVAGPVEATAIGNIMVQALATGRVASMSEARAIVRASFDVKEYAPRGRDGWDAAYERYLLLV